MTAALLLIVASVAIGTVLGLARDASGRSGPFHTFALVAVVVVVLAHLLPEAMAELGGWALVTVAASFALPRVLGRVVHRYLGVGVELGYWAVLVHRVADGIAIGVFAGPVHGSDSGQLAVVLAICAHAIPVTAIVVLSFRRRLGSRQAILRALGLVAASWAGLGLTGHPAAAALQQWQPWITAVASGLLLQLVSHGWSPQPPPNLRSRALDALAMLAGAALALLGGHGHVAGPEAEALDERIVHSLIDLTLQTAPVLVAGLVFGAVIQQFGTARLMRRASARLRGGMTGQLGAGSLLGLSLPVAAGDVLSLARRFRAGGAGMASITAFVLATPLVGIETFALSVWFLGWRFALVRLVGAGLLAVAAGLLVAWGCGSEAASPRSHGEPLLPPPWVTSGAASLPGQLARNFDELIYHSGAWMVLGLVVAAYTHVALAADGLANVQPVLALMLVSAVGVSTYACAVALIPLGAVLLAKGLSWGVVLAVLLLVPAATLTTLKWYRSTYGWRATGWLIGSQLAVVWSLAVGLDRSLLMPSASSLRVVSHAHGWAHYAGALVLGLLLLRSIWREGLRAWLGSLGESFGDEGEHSHGHAASLALLCCIPSIL